MRQHSSREREEESNTQGEGNAAPLKGRKQHHTQKKREDSSTTAKEGNNTTRKEGRYESTSTRKGRERKQHQSKEGRDAAFFGLVLPSPHPSGRCCLFPSSLEYGATFGTRLVVGAAVLLTSLVALLSLHGPSGTPLGRHCFPPPFGVCAHSIYIYICWMCIKYVGSGEEARPPKTEKGE